MDQIADKFQWLTIERGIILFSILGWMWSIERFRRKGEQKDPLFHVANGATAANLPLSICILLIAIGLIDISYTQKLVGGWTFYWAGATLSIIGWKALFAVE